MFNPLHLISSIIYESFIKGGQHGSSLHHYIGLYSYFFKARESGVWNGNGKCSPVIWNAILQLNNMISTTYVEVPILVVEQFFLLKHVINSFLVRGIKVIALYVYLA